MLIIGSFIGPMIMGIMTPLNKTILKTNVLGNIDGTFGGSRFVAYTAKLTSDTVDDIVLGYGSVNTNHIADSLFLILFKGEETNLVDKDTAYEDTSANFGYITFGAFVNNHDEMDMPSR